MSTDDNLFSNLSLVGGNEDDAVEEEEKSSLHVITSKKDTPRTSNENISSSDRQIKYDLPSGTI